MRAVPGLLAGLLTMVLALGAARAQDFPTRPIQIVVPWPPGAIDITVRMIKAPMEQNLGQPVIVETKPGANGYIGTQAVAEAKPDGYTLLANTSSSIVMGPLTSRNARFQVQRDFVPISGIYGSQFVLVVRKSLPVKTLAELIAYAKQNPGKLTFGSGGGTGSSLYLAAELLRLKTGIAFQHVPYRGAAAALNDLLGAHIDLMFDAMPVMSQQAKAGNVTALAVTSAQRSAVLPDVPTMMEAGLKDFEVVNYFGLFAPPNTPAEIVQHLRDAIAKSIAAPSMVEEFAKQGMTPVASEPGNFAQLLAAELDRWAQVIQAAGIKAD